MKADKTVAIVRGKFLNAYEMQLFEKLPQRFKLTAFSSLTPFHDKFRFPVVKLPSPMDIPDFPYKMPILNRILSDAHYLWGLEAKLKEFDLVHTAETYYHYTQQCLNAKRKGYVKKVITTVLENIPFNNEGIWGRKAFKKRARIELDHMIALTHKTKTALIQEGADPRKITVIGHAINTDRFLPVKRPTSKRIVILFVGRLEAYKGVYEIIHAAKNLLVDPELREYHLDFVMVGQGSQKRALIALEQELNIRGRMIHKNVAYSHMPREYQGADIFVAPSKPTATWDEQYNTALLEAQASGLPIVSTRTGGIPENVGDAGMLVHPGDIDGLTKALKTFILSPRLRLQFGKKARKRALTVHDARVVAKRMASLYDQVMSRK